MESRTQKINKRKEKLNSETNGSDIQKQTEANNLDFTITVNDRDIDEDYQQEDFGVYQGPINEAPEYNSDTGIYPDHEYPMSDDYENAYVDQASYEDWREYEQEHPQAETEDFENAYIDQASYEDWR